MRKIPAFITPVLFLTFIFILPASPQEVDQDGSFAYTYPITIPAGTNNVQPKISLSCNSNAGRQEKEF